MKKEKNKVEDDLKLIKNDNCSDSFGCLLDRHQNLFYSMCNKFSSRLDANEVYKDKYFVFYRAVNSYKEEKKAKFSTWLANYTRYHCLNYIKHNGKYVSVEDDAINHFYNKKSMDDFDPTEQTKSDIEQAFTILEKLSDKRIFKIFKLRYLNDNGKLTWKKIADKFNLTPQTIINLHTKGRRILKRKMKK